jgi:dTDP-4-dehydrorhamnose 3,5-epimerase
MEITTTKINGLYLIKPKVFEDDRGYFMESFKDEVINGLVPGLKFIQDNQSKSSYGVIRGLHFQKEPYAQTKLIRVLEGEILDAVVDLRKNSDTYGMHLCFLLNESNRQQVLIPPGCAHGFSVKSNAATVLYKVDKPYSPLHEGGIEFNDKKLNIDWQIPEQKIIISKKDMNYQEFKW